MSLLDIIRNATGMVHDNANVRMVYGDPIQAGDKTIIPVAAVRFGFGGGGGTERRNEDGLRAEEEEAEGKRSAGGGGGGGVMVKPVGVIEVSSTGTRYISFGESRKMAALLIGGVLAWMLLRRVRRR